ncbi:MAG: ABC transporter permease [Spirochaetota bacterium]
MSTQKRTQILSTVLWIIMLVIAWESVASIVQATKRSPENVLPRLHQIADSVVSDNRVTRDQTALQLVLSNAATTLLRAGLGFVIGAGIGFGLAVLMRRFVPVEKTVFPYLMLIQMIPILGMAPIVLAITRSIDTSRVVIAAILTFYPVATNTLAGLKSVEPAKLDLMQSISASEAQIYTKLIIPTSVPYLFTGLKIAAPMAITASILVDTLQGGPGLGTMLSQSLRHAMSIYVFWQIVFFSAAIGMLGYYGMSLVERLLSPHERVKAPT